MGEVRMTLVGKERFLKKDNSGYWHKIYYVCEFSSAKKEAGCLGSESCDDFVSEECWHSIKPEHIGKEFVLEYGMNEYRKPVITGLIFAEDK